jgi:hypothetical protein
MLNKYDAGIDACLSGSGSAYETLSSAHEDLQILQSNLQHGNYGDPG